MTARAESTSPTLLERLRATDDQQAWARFVEIYTPLIFFWAQRMGMPLGGAADLVQEVLAILVVKLPQFRLDTHGSFRAWLRTVTTNKLRDMWRKQANMALPTSPSVLAEIPEREDTQFWEVEYRQQLVRRLLELARPDFEEATWQAVRASMTSDRPVSEIAEEYKVSVWTLYSARSRLLARLRRDARDLLD